MQRIKIDKESCMSCLNCVIGCMAEHNKKSKSIYDLDLEDLTNESKNHIELDSNKCPIPILCRHCEKPECVYTCMSGAMSKNKNTGLVTYNEEQCSSCFMCIMACPYGVLKADEVEKILIQKCDMCNERQIPRCVEDCPTGCLSIEGGQ
ncbi:putative carbon-monoxide dehydrogenase iron sulfur subunit [Clostridium aceticum]|uniref:Putative carbon-monoxide dehydrogenase iron sulfur subunit n=1 Tax=Clostridium aceticum TaxID=84022 RepID=A0A0D8IDB2_9CLOT|nr:4Fe-4S dicluster domain-containing protein [Clostridium aceticum]AKL95070.1 putative carbon-monoxide dehydrogenase iron sulfur subunit [Clostridium aceticum]KJF27957.1 4Fe-4S ferredoxin [Clostridium aceticum]